MLTNYELEKYLEKHNVPLHACDYIRETRKKEPARLVGSRAGGHVTTSYASMKMGRTIQTESSTGELAAAITFESGDDVLEFWDQCPAVKVKRKNKNGEIREGTYTPDFLILTNNGPEIIECKPMKEIEQ